MGTLGEATEAEKQGRRDDIELSYYTVQPNRWTFQSRKIREWVEARLRGRVLNACAGKTKLAHDCRIVRNDIDTDRDADLHVDVCEIADHFEPSSFDTIVYDPPFTSNQASRSYELEDGEEVVAGDDALAKRQFDDLLTSDGRVIQFGFTTTCMPMSMELPDGTPKYRREAAAIWNTLGRMNDYLSVVDVRTDPPEYDTGWFE